MPDKLLGGSGATMSAAPPAKTIRFTPEELIGLLKSGSIDLLKDGPLLDPADQATLKSLWPKFQNPDAPGMMTGANPPLPPSFGPLGALAGELGSGGSRMPPEPPNLSREGNLTRPGPSGPGSPSAPSRPPYNPLSDSNQYKGPMGNEDNWRTIGKPSPSKMESPSPKMRSFSSGEEKGMKDLGQFQDWLHGPDQPTKGNGQYKEPTNTPNKPLMRQPASSSMDEADKRKIMFGGAGEGPTSRPQDRGPVGKKTPQKRKP